MIGPAEEIQTLAAVGRLKLVDTKRLYVASNWTRCGRPPCIRGETAGLREFQHYGGQESRELSTNSSLATVYYRRNFSGVTVDVTPSSCNKYLGRRQLWNGRCSGPPNEVFLQYFLIQHPLPPRVAALVLPFYWLPGGSVGAPRITLSHLSPSGCSIGAPLSRRRVVALVLPTRRLPAYLREAANWDLGTTCTETLLATSLVTGQGFEAFRFRILLFISHYSVPKEVVSSLAPL